MQQNKRTCLYPRHEAMGALISPFGGFDMPIQYSDIISEHQAVRQACGVFDVSHMGEFRVTGKDATAFVNHIFTNDMTQAADGQILYGMMLNPSGGVVDDLLVYRYNPEHYLLVVNASNIDKDWEWVTGNSGNFDVSIENLSDETGELAIQGPEAEKAMVDVLGIPCAGLTFYTFGEYTFNGAPVLVSRTGYTGEDGFEIYASHEITVQIWDTLLKNKAALPCGLGCRDTLRFEVGLPLYGDELSDDITPLEAGLGIFVKFDKPEFIGREALLRQKEEGLRRRIVGLELLDRNIARHGYEVLSPEGEVIGHVTTGYRGISTDRSIAMALIDARYAAKDTEVKVRIRRKEIPARVVAKKFYKKSYKK